MDSVFDARHLFFINPVSFPHKAQMDAVVADIDRAFQKMDARHTILFSRFPRDAIGAVRRYAQDHVEMGKRVRVYAVGGDGILFDCLNAVIGLENTELANVPYGTHNDFLRAFGDESVPLFRNIEQLAAAPSIETDVINCDGNYALNFATMGMESTIQLRATGVRRQLGRFRGSERRFASALYSAYGLMEAFEWKTLNQRYTITADGADYSGVYSSISLANGSCYAGNRYISLAAVPNDGLLNLTLHDGLRPRDTLTLLRTFGKETGGARDGVTRRAVRGLTVSSERPIPVSLDGELFFDAEAHLEIVPQAVRIIAPGHLAYEGRRVHEYHE